MDKWSVCVALSNTALSSALFTLFTILQVYNTGTNTFNYSLAHLTLVEYQFYSRIVLGYPDFVEIQFSRNADRIIVTHCIGPRSWKNSV